MRKIILPLLLATTFIACTPKQEEQKKETVTNVEPTVPTGRVAIPKDSANKMISSYLNSISGSTSADSNLHSLIIDADSLRAYLNDTTKPKIRHMKLMFAHTLDYINNGGKDKYAGYNEAALTLVIAGYDDSSNYVFYNTNYVFDNCKPCPYNCPTSGTASNDRL